MSTVRSLRYLKSKQIYEVNLKEMQKDALDRADLYVELALTEISTALAIPLLVRAADLYQASIAGTQNFFPLSKWKLLRTYARLLNELGHKVNQEDNSSRNDILQLMVDYCDKMANSLDQLRDELGQDEEWTLLNASRFYHYRGLYNYLLTKIYTESDKWPLAQITIKASLADFETEQGLLSEAHANVSLNPETYIRHALQSAEHARQTVVTHNMMTLGFLQAPKSPTAPSSVDVQDDYRQEYKM